MRGEAAFAWVRNDLSKFQVFTTGGIDLAVAAAQNWPRRGHTVRQTIDCLVATFCLEAGHWLLHRDRDFDPLEQHLGLRVIHP